MLTTESDTPPLAPGKTVTLKKWLLQEDGSYKPIFVEKPASHPLVSSMISDILSDESPVDSRRGVIQTWGIIATLIRQHDQLDVSQKTCDNGQDAHVSAFINTNENIIREGNDIEDDDFDDTLDTEHDVFNDFIDKDQGDDPYTDILDCIVIEGTPALRKEIRNLLEEYRTVFSTTLSTEPATIPPFELEVDLEKWETFNNRGPPRVQRLTNCLRREL